METADEEIERLRRALTETERAGAEIRKHNERLLARVKQLEDEARESEAIDARELARTERARKAVVLKGNEILRQGLAPEMRDRLWGSDLEELGALIDALNHAACPESESAPNPIPRENPKCPTCRDSGFVWGEWKRGHAVPCNHGAV